MVWQTNIDLTQMHKYGVGEIRPYNHNVFEVFVLIDVHAALFALDGTDGFDQLFCSSGGRSWRLLNLQKTQNTCVL